MKGRTEPALLTHVLSLFLSPFFRDVLLLDHLSFQTLSRLLQLISEIEMARLDDDPADKLVASLNMMY